MDPQVNLFNKFKIKIVGKMKVKLKVLQLNKLYPKSSDLIMSKV